jgi:hypothetical protein
MDRVTGSATMVWFLQQTNKPTNCPIQPSNHRRIK